MKSDPATRQEQAHEQRQTLTALSFEQWYHDFYPKLARTMTVMFSNVEVGRELADEAMARAFARWESGDIPHSPNAWTTTVAVNEGRRRWRRRKRDADRLTQTAASSPLTAGLDAPDLDLWRAVAELPRRSREAIVLRYIADMTEAEVAKTMGVKPGSASALLNKACDRTPQLNGDASGSAEAI
ncbi:MAG: sigma-70 family RNA polymerase sigma factor [Actinomycetia bacterium]|nr:sigma-70 family RNA polymerase sigma factor [Actinomycetes bacterium]